MVGGSSASRPIKTKILRHLCGELFVGVAATKMIPRGLDLSLYSPCVQMSQITLSEHHTDCERRQHASRGERRELCLRFLLRSTSHCSGTFRHARECGTRRDQTSVGGRARRPRGSGCMPSRLRYGPAPGRAGPTLVGSGFLTCGSSVHNSMVHSEWTVCVPVGATLRVARPVGCAYALRLGVAVGA